MRKTVKAWKKSQKKLKSMFGYLESMRDETERSSDLVDSLAEDIAGAMNFPDAVLRFKTNDHLNLRDVEQPGTEFDVPLRAFLVKAPTILEGISGRGMFARLRGRRTGPADPHQDS